MTGHLVKRTQNSVLPEHHVLLQFTHELLHNALRRLDHVACGQEEGRLGAQGYIEKKMRNVSGKYLTGDLIVQEEVTGGQVPKRKLSHGKEHMLGKVMPGHLWYLRLVERKKASTVSEQDFCHESLKLILPS